MISYSVTISWDTLKAMKKKITSRQEPQKQFASNPNLTITRGTYYIYERPEALLLHFHKWKNKTQLCTIYSIHPLFLSWYLCFFLRVKSKKLIIYRLCGNLALEITEKTFPHHNFPVVVIRLSHKYIQ